MGRAAGRPVGSVDQEAEEAEVGRSHEADRVTHHSQAHGVARITWA